MPRVAFTANLERHLSCPVQTVPGDTVRAVLDGVFAAQPRLRSCVVHDQDRVRRHVAIDVNGDRIAARERLSDAVGESDEVFVLQALSGGRRRWSTASNPGVTPAAPAPAAASKIQP